ncbi:MAG TPA: geranylgeranyl reductase family protein [Solirubrobacterales bacterium]|nr:geranylgeranyl reductase family protein [Solirubrobacterales bacterium]
MNDPPPLIDEAEVVVVGGGPAGSVAAASLAELGRDVLIADQSSFPRDKPCGDGLTHSAVQVLEELGLESIAAESQQVEDCRIVIAHATETKGWYRPPRRLPRSRFMRTVPRRALDLALLDAAIERGARFLRARVDGPLMDDGEARGVLLSQAGEHYRIDARCVIAADGATSRMRRTCGIGGATVGTQVYALRRYFTTQQQLDPVFDVYVPLLYEGGLLAGYGWVFPIAERRANVGVAYYGPPAGRPRARIRSVLSSFVRELQEQEGERFGQLTHPSDLLGAPIAVQFSPDRCQLGNVLFAGEAARAADPLTGEGISFALRSGRTAATAADRLLTSGRAPDLGRELGRQFPRLGQNLALLTRVAAGATEGFRLSEAEHQAFVLAIRRVTGSAPDDPGIEPTQVRRLLASDDALAGALDRVNERLLDSLRTGLPFGLETLHREVRARGGPMAAACALLATVASDGELGEAAITAAQAAELVALLDRCFPRMSARVGSDVAWLNNALAALLGDLALTAALDAPARSKARCVGEIGAGVRRISEGQMNDAEDRYDADRSLERCSAALDARAGTPLCLAARLGAIAAGQTDVEEVGSYGRHVGIAYQISEDIRELTVGEELTRRRPGSDLREGIYPLPVAYALAADPELRELLSGPVAGEAVEGVRARIRDSGALDEAAADCFRHIEHASRIAAHAPPGSRELLIALAELPIRRLEGVVGTQAGAVATASG